MAAQPNGSNQAAVRVQPENASGGTEVRLGNQSSQYARRNGIPEITRKDALDTGRNRRDQTDVTRISATLPDGTTYRQNWLEAMRGEARITLPLRTPQARDDKRDGIRDAILERHFAENDVSFQTRGTFMGRSKMGMGTPRVSPAPGPAMTEGYPEEVMDDADDDQSDTSPDMPAPPDPPRPSATVEGVEPAEQDEGVVPGLSMAKLRGGMMGPAIATASATGIMSLLALSSSDPSNTTAAIHVLTHLIT